MKNIKKCGKINVCYSIFDIFSFVSIKSEIQSHFNGSLPLSCWSRKSRSLCFVYIQSLCKSKQIHFYHIRTLFIRYIMQKHICTLFVCSLHEKSPGISLFYASLWLNLRKNNEYLISPLLTFQFDSNINGMQTLPTWNSSHRLFDYGNSVSFKASFDFVSAEHCQVPQRNFNLK